MNGSLLRTRFDDWTEMDDGDFDLRLGGVGLEIAHLFWYKTIFLLLYGQGTRGHEQDCSGHHEEQLLKQ